MSVIVSRSITPLLITGHSAHMQVGDQAAGKEGGVLCFVASFSESHIHMHTGSWPGRGCPMMKHLHLIDQWQVDLWSMSYVVSEDVFPPPEWKFHGCIFV